MTGTVFMFPGQGSQRVGMGRALHDNHPQVRQLFEEASDVLGRDLRKLCFDGPEAELTQTENAQPAMTLVNVACLHALRAEGIAPAVVAGHSVGEYAALCAAGALSFADALRVVQVRANAMSAAAQANPGGMAAVFGLDAETLNALCAEIAGGVEVANHNGPNQIVLTGTAEGLAAASKAAKARGAKLVIPLKVSGAWHSRFMAAAQAPLREALGAIPVQAPAVETIANVTAAPYADAAAVRAALVEQIVRPVLWSQSISALVARQFRMFIEVGPGRVLSGLMKEISKSVTTANVEDADSLARLRALMTQPSA